MKVPSIYRKKNIIESQESSWVMDNMVFRCCVQKVVFLPLLVG